MTTLYILLAVLVVLVVWLIAAFNGLVTGRNRVKEAWSDINVQLRRRHDLIPNLVSTVKGYAAHEKGVLDDVTKARSQQAALLQIDPVKLENDPKLQAEFFKAQETLSGSLVKLNSIVENYPNLKADDGAGAVSLAVENYLDAPEILFMVLRAGGDPPRATILRGLRVLSPVRRELR